MGQAEAVVIEVFEYPAGPEIPVADWDGLIVAFPEKESGTRSVVQRLPQIFSGHEGTQRDQFEQQVPAIAQQNFERGRQQGIQEGREAGREIQRSAEADRDMCRAEQVSALAEEFKRERDRFLHHVEHEVVELALAVAARILRREAQTDPLLLTGAVRIALGQLSESTKVRLRVPRSELELWTEAMAHLPNLALRPLVLAGDGMRLGDCIVDTELGSVDLGVRAQLGEIEHGFFDRSGTSRTQPLAQMLGDEERIPLP